MAVCQELSAAGISVPAPETFSGPEMTSEQAKRLVFAKYKEEAKQKRSLYMEEAGKAAHALARSEKRRLDLSQDADDAQATRQVLQKLEQDVATMKTVRSVVALGALPVTQTTDIQASLDGLLDGVKMVPAKGVAGMPSALQTASDS